MKIEEKEEGNSLKSPPIADLPKLLEACVNHLNDALVITQAEPIDMPGPRIVWANQSFYNLTGYSPDEVIGQSPRILQGPGTDRAVLDKVRAALEKWQSVRAEVLNYRKDGTTYWNEFEIVPIANEDGWFTHWVSVQRDVTLRKALEEKVRKLAFYDPLTWLPNRRLLEDRLGQAMTASKRSGLHGALMFLDLDNFKPLNDLHGHAVGDLLLIEVAHRLTNCVRKVDTIARLGGDEFIILISELSVNPCQSTNQARKLAEKIRDALAAPYRLSVLRADETETTVEHHCSGSIGVVMFADHQSTQADLIAHADTAMYQAKETGRNAIRFYEA